MYCTVRTVYYASWYRLMTDRSKKSERPVVFTQVPHEQNNETRQDNIASSLTETITVQYKA